MRARHPLRIPAKTLNHVLSWFQNDFLGLVRQMRLSYLPPRMVYFAGMAAFINWALSASHLGTPSLNGIFGVQRGQVDQLGILMITASSLSLILPVITVLPFKPSHHSAGRRLADFMKSLHHVHH